jgi:hypothetical protein
MEENKVIIPLDEYNRLLGYEKLAKGEVTLLEDRRHGYTTLSFLGKDEGILMLTKRIEELNTGMGRAIQTARETERGALDTRFFLTPLFVRISMAITGRLTRMWPNHRQEGE